MGRVGNNHSKSFILPCEMTAKLAVLASKNMVITPGIPFSKLLPFVALIILEVFSMKLLLIVIK